MTRASVSTVGRGLHASNIADTASLRCLSAIDCEPSAIDSEPSTIDSERRAIDCEPSAIDCELSAIDCERL